MPIYMIHVLCTFNNYTGCSMLIELISNVPRKFQTRNGESAKKWSLPYGKKGALMR